MKQIDISFLSLQANQILNETARRFSEISLPIKALKKIATALTTGIISVEKAIQWIAILPVLIAYRIATKRLNNFLVFGPSRNYFRPKFWPNTPHILPYHLHHQLENIFLLRLALAAALSSNYGIYCPLYEFYDTVPAPQKEEYMDSENTK